MLVVVVEMSVSVSVVVIVDVHGGVVVTARGDNLDAVVAQRGIHRGELHRVRNIDILQGDLNLLPSVLGYRSPLLEPPELTNHHTLSYFLIIIIKTNSVLRGVCLGRIVRWRGALPMSFAQRRIPAQYPCSVFLAQILPS